jgi:hypothetical protein
VHFARAGQSCGAVDGQSEMGANPGACLPLLARRAPVALSTTPHGDGLTAKIYIHKLNERFKIAKRGGQLPFLGLFWRYAARS